MGQVCVKPKRSGRVKPGTAATAASGSSASSASYVSAASAASVQLELPTSAVEAYPDQTCTRISIAKTRSGTGKETLACDFFGGVGCFVCNVESIKDLLLYQSTVMTSADGTTKLQNQAIFDMIQTDGVCVKIFFEEQGKTENKNFTNEVASYAILKNITRQYFNLFTTYAEYIDPSGKPHTAFTVAFGQAFQVEIDGTPVKQLRCILLRQCNMDVLQLIKNHQPIDQHRLFNDVSYMLYMLHSYGYAHGDIKPENIVYCPNEPISYKLIDFNLKRHTRVELPFAFTGKYILPRLFYEGIRKAANRPYLTMMESNTHMMEEYYPNSYFRFLLHKSNEKINSLTDGVELYYKSDEYAMAMTLLEINEITDVYLYYLADHWVVEQVERLTDPEVYFKSLSTDAYNKYVSAAVARSQRSQRSARRSGGAKRKTIKKPNPPKTPLKDTSKKSSH